MGLRHSPVGSRMKQVNNCTDQCHPGCGLLQRVYRTAGRPHVHMCLHEPPNFHFPCVYALKAWIHLAQTQYGMGEYKDFCS